MGERDWSIQQIARVAGTTSRTLRHYDAIGLLAPSGVGGNGYRRYDEAALVRLQRILLLRELGLGLSQIAEILDRGEREEIALEHHLGWLRQEQSRLSRQIAAVESTITALRGGEELMAEKMFDGFDHTVHEQEVVERWGAEAYRESDRWWRGMDDRDRQDWTTRTADLARDWVAAAERGLAPDSSEAQALAERHVAWLRGVPGTPAAQGGGVRGYVLGLAEMYVSDPRFARNYETSAGGAAGAAFVRDALRVYAESKLT